MSRHSKNNTAGSVFTYSERQKLKSMNEWGEVRARIGRDSQKKFEQCSLCLKTLVDAMCCPKGHTFCNECVIENLLLQKKENKKKLKLWQEEQSKVNLEVDKFTLEKINLLKNNEDGILRLDTESNVENFLPDYRITEKNTVEEVAENRSKCKLKERAEMTQNCFWLPEKTPTHLKDDKVKPADTLFCPGGEKDHTIKLKDLIRLKISNGKDGKSEEDQFTCCVCSKELSVQKIIALRTCGHVLCKFIDSSCTACNLPFSESDIINLQESGTGFSTHNQVVTQKLNPFFKF